MAEIRDESIQIRPGEITWTTELYDGTISGSSYLFGELVRMRDPEKAFERALADVVKDAKKWWRDYKRDPEVRAELKAEKEAEAKQKAKRV